MKEVYIHGLGQVPDSWQKIISLNGVDNSICPDLTKLVREKEVTYHVLYDAFSTLCDSIKEPLCLCGLSLGAVLALNYAIEHQENVKALVLAGAQYKMPKRMLQFQNVMFRIMPESMFQRTGFTKKDFITLCKTMMELDFSESLSKITCPTMIICGSKDKANRSASVELAGILNNSELRVLKGVGHEVNVEAPQNMSDLLREFYKRVL